MSVQLKRVTAYLDKVLQTKKYSDSSLNGLQVDGKKTVGRIGFGVDASLDTFKQAVSAGCDMLIVHHGLFWGNQLPVIGTHYQRLKFLIDNGVSLYASHLPLDVHKQLGNNAQLGKIAGLRNSTLFGTYHGEKWGYSGSVRKTTLNSMKEKYEESLGVKTAVHRFGPKVIRRIGIVSGGGTFAFEEAAAKKLDLLITGEARHSHFHDAKELHLNVLYLGHYASETVGLKAVERTLKRVFSISTVFLDVPTKL